MRILAIILLCSCSVIRDAEKVQTLDMNNLLDSYYETVWSSENNKPNEQDSIKLIIKNKLK